MDDHLKQLMDKLDRMKESQEKLQSKLASYHSRSAALRAGRLPPTEDEQPAAGSGEHTGEDARDSAGLDVGGAGRLGSQPSRGYGSDQPAAGHQDHPPDFKPLDKVPPGQCAEEAYNMYTMDMEVFRTAAADGNQQALAGSVHQWRDDPFLLSEALHLSAANGHLECARLLVENGADLNYWNSKQDETVLTAAAAGGHADLVEWLITAGCEVRKVTQGDRHSALHSAATAGHAECARVLLRHGADVNAVDTFGITPLMAACKEGQTELVTLLLSANADHTMKSRVRKETAFSMAVEGNHANCVQELVTRFPEEGERPLKGKDGLRPLHHAIRYNLDEIACALIDAGVNLSAPDGPWTPIHLALEMGNVALVSVLAEFGADLNAPLPVPKEVTLLMLAVCKENVDMVHAISSQPSCNLDQFDELGRTALYHAVKSEQTQSVETLIANGANVDAYASCMVTNRSAGSAPPVGTALHGAIFRDNPEAAALLIGAGCDMDVPVLFEEDGTVNYFTPLQVAILKKSTWAVNMLVEAGAAISQETVGWCQRFGIGSDITGLLQTTLARRKREPSRLKQVCRDAVRKFLGKVNFYGKIKELDVPHAIKDHLLMKDLQGYMAA